MSDREQSGLRGPVRSCTEDGAYFGVPDAEGKTVSEVHSGYAWEYDIDGRILVACRREFVTADAAGGIGVFPLDRSGVGGISVDVAAEFAS